MNLEFFGNPLERKIVSEIFRWTEDVLSKENELFNGLPPCPYAEKAWQEGKAAILFKYENNYQCLYSTISRYDDNLDVVIIVDMNNRKTPQEFHSYLDSLNTAISEGIFIDKDIWVMGFHPEDDPSDFAQVVDFEPSTHVEYSLIFVQRLSKLQESAYKLKKAGYYDTYDTNYNVEDVYLRRETLYRRLKNGNVPS